jgi:hypothetical protein
MKHALLASALLLAACSKNMQTAEAVRQAVVDDLQARATQTGIKPDAMEVAISAVSFGANQAHATVAFTPKGAPAGSGMSMDSVLDDRNGKWVVTKRQLSGNPFGGSGGGAPQLPPGHPSTSPETVPPGTSQPGNRQ